MHPAFADFVRGGAAPRAGIAEGREDIVACQAATALIASRREIAVGGEAAVGGSWRVNGSDGGKGGAR